MNICAVDVGSTFIKAAGYDAELRMLGSARTGFPAVVDGGRAEADPQQMWLALASTVRQATAAVGVPVTALVLSAQMAGLALLDRQARPLGPVILGVDRRGDGVPADPRTGCPSGAIYPVGKLAWLAAHQPQRLAAACYVGGVKEYLLHRLAGVWVTDPSSASTTGLYDVSAGHWLPDPRHIRVEHLPLILRPGARAGVVSPQAAGECGLPAGTPVFTGVGDGPAASLACGAVGGARLCLSLGTTLVARLLVRGHTLPQSRVPFFIQHVDGDWYGLGVRFDLDGETCTPVGAPGLRLSPSQLPAVLRPLLDTYGVRELRPIGGRDTDLRRLADAWGLPVRTTGAYDGTRGAALLALAGADTEPGLERLAARVPVIAEVTPQHAERGIPEDVDG